MEEENKVIELPADFCWKQYIVLNDDLKDLNEEQLIMHYTTQGYTENRQYNYLKLSTDCNIFICCSGKSGSTTLYTTFINNGYKSIHCHGNENFKNNSLIYKHFKLDLHELIELNSKKYERIYIIDSYRTPIERKISSFFENLEKLEKLENLLDKSIIDIENYAAINDVLNYYNLDYFNTFDFDKKYNIKHYKNITFIKLRFEDINEWSTILSEIFNKPIIIHKDNLTINKKYYNIYNIIKQKYIIPDYLLTLIENDREFKIYNTPAKQKEYLDYWKSRSKPSNYIFKNIPEDFDPEMYIKLNIDLVYFTLLEAKMHYNNTGYLENRIYK